MSLEQTIRSESQPTTKELLMNGDCVILSGKEIVAVKMQTIYSRTLTLLKRRENLVSVARRHASLLAFCVPVFPSVATTQWLIFRTKFETKNGKDGVFPQKRIREN